MGKACRRHQGSKLVGNAPETRNSANPVAVVLSGMAGSTTYASMFSPLSMRLQ